MYKCAYLFLPVDLLKYHSILYYSYFTLCCVFTHLKLFYFQDTHSHNVGLQESEFILNLAWP